MEKEKGRLRRPGKIYQKKHSMCLYFVSIADCMMILGRCRAAVMGMIDQGRLKARADEYGKIWISKASIETFKEWRIADLNHRLIEKLMKAEPLMGGKI